MDENSNREIVQKVIDAVAQPDNPERLAALAARESNAQRRVQRQAVFDLIWNAVVLLGFVIVLLIIWQRNSAFQTRWVSLMVGFAAGLMICIVSERRKAHQRGAYFPKVALLVGVLVILSSLTISQVKQSLSPSMTAAIEVAGFTFFAIVSGYALFVSLRKMRSERARE